MNTVKVPKTKLLTKLKTNRKKHREIFLKAQEGYRQMVVEQLEEMLENARQGKKIETYVNLHAPVDQTKDYDRVISMLDMSVDKIIQLSSTEFANYVMDDWSWKEQFTMSNMAYLTKVGASI